MNISKNLNFQFILILLFFISSYFGVALINLTILSILIYFFKNKNYEFELIDKILIFFGIYLILSSIFHLNYSAKLYLIFQIYIFILVQKFFLQILLKKAFIK